MMRSSLLYSSLALASVLLGSCGADYTTMRQEHARSMVQERANATRSLLEERGPLDRAGCIAIALDRNLDADIADLQHRLAGIERDTGFGLFLPQVELGYTLRRSLEPVQIGQDGMYQQTGDQGSGNFAISIQQPLLLHIAWTVPLTRMYWPS